MSDKHTREWWEERLPLIQAFVEGKSIQMNCMAPDGGREWKTRDTPDFSCPIDNYRIAPERKLRPWKPQEVPVGALIRLKGNHCQHSWLIVGYAHNEQQIAFGQTGGRSIKDLGNYEHSTDGGKTWAPCGVMEEQQ